MTAATPLQAAALGLSIVAEARWPESAHDHTPPNLPGFILSSFSPIAAETAARCLSRRPEAARPSATAIVIATARGDRQSAAHVAQTVAASGILGPLLFFQSVPNAVAGHIAARWNLTGPVVCLADPVSALETAALLIEDGDADQAILLHIEQGDRDQAHAVLLQPVDARPVDAAQPPPGAHP
ncbi:beta-ketoacyl synthase chain length factor [Catenulispora pinisilvae]|uniref:beta-ketoacyl synthase chain length factor n=1 Tax=Catenulispora pinisilvae TaxID=2705253 RepID=UPI003F69D388